MNGRCEEGGDSGGVVHNTTMGAGVGTGVEE